jgi:rhodanese-related sulfurtransferase
MLIPETSTSQPTPAREPRRGFAAARSGCTVGRPATVLDVRERDAYEAAHIPGAAHIPRGQLELRVNNDLPDPTRRIVLCCELGMISTLAAATLQDMGFRRAVALDGGMKAWRESGFPVEKPGASRA